MMYKYPPYTRKYIRMVHIIILDTLTLKVKEFLNSSRRKINLGTSERRRRRKSGIQKKVRSVGKLNNGRKKRRTYNVHQYSVQ